MVFQGELCGPSIQKNRLGLSENDLFIFTIYNQETKKYLTWHERIDICRDLGLKHVHVDSFGLSFDFTIDELLENAKGKYPNTNNHREGLVYEVTNGDDKEFGGRLTFKVINNDFLLKGGD